MRQYLILFAICISYLPPYFAIGLENKGSVTDLPLMRFVSLKTSEVNIRSGPSSHYPVKLTYKCINYPLQVIAEFDNWRLLKDIDGSQGWIHSSLISGNRYAVVIRNAISQPLTYKVPMNEAVILRMPKENAHPVARIEIGAIVKLKKCDLMWCMIKADKYQGWILKNSLWGVQDHEVITK
jgi:SH3-like domain-containing protein